MTQSITRQSLLETLQAYKKTSLLRAAIELGVFDALDAGPQQAGPVAAAIGADERSTRILLGAMAATGLLESDGTKFALPEGSGKLLVSTSPEYAGHAVRINTSDQEWDAMRDLADVVRHGGTLMETDAEVPEFRYWEDFAAQGTFVTRAAADTFRAALRPWAAAKPDIRLLDIGCGHSLFGLLFAQEFQQAHVSGLDWETVLVRAKEHAQRMNLAERTTFIAGDAFAVPLQGPYDVVVLANFLPMFSVERGTFLLRRIAEAVRPGGRVAIVGFTVGDEPPAREHAAHMLSLLMLAWTRKGEAHSTETYRRMLAASGFSGTQVHQVAGLPVRVLIAERP